MRKLSLNDAFKAAAIIRKAKVRDELAELVASAGSEGQMKLGASVVLMLIEKAPDVQDDLCEFIASLKGCSASDVHSMPLEDVITFGRELAAENDLGSFFRSAAGSAASM